MALGMVDRSRILLCFLTFLCLSFNPLTALLRWGGAHDSDQHPSSGSGRSVLSLESGGWRPPVPPHEWAVVEERACGQTAQLLTRSQRALAVTLACLLLVGAGISCNLQVTEQT